MKKRKLKKKFKVLIVLLLTVLSITIGIVLYISNNKINEDALEIKLIGDDNITIKWNEEKYIDEGATAKYKDKDLTNSIETSDNLQLDKIGKYSYKYKIKYKNIEKTIERIVNVVEYTPPEIKLKGDEKIIVAEGQYKEKGATAIDNYDGDITDKIEIDTSNFEDKVGTQKIIYKIKDSSGNENSVERTVIIKEKAKNTKNQKVAVLNYHFFYKDEEDRKKNCNQSICLDIKKFKEHLKYLNDNEFKILTIDEFVEWMYGELEIPEKSVLITIDDGWWGTSKEFGNYLIPALEEYKAHATLFLVVGWWETKNYESKYLSLESHTYDLHYEYGNKCKYRSKVNCVPYDELKKDLHKSAYVLKSHKAFCFPFYDYTEQSIKAVKEEGFKVAFIGGYRKASRSDDKYKIPRYPIQSSITMNEFKNMVN